MSCCGGELRFEFIIVCSFQLVNEPPFLLSKFGRLLWFTSRPPPCVVVVVSLTCVLECRIWILPYYYFWQSKVWHGSDRCQTGVRKVSERCQNFKSQICQFWVHSFFESFLTCIQMCLAKSGGPNFVCEVRDSETFVKMRFPSCCGDLPTQAQWSRCIHLRYTRPWEVSSSLTTF